MSALLYNLSIYGYQFIIWLVSPFNQKAKLRISDLGFSIADFEKKLRTISATDLNPKSEIENPKSVAWFHCASLGEFEQGLPIIEQLKLQQPDTKFLITFFSPSGYEVRKNYQGADWIFYLPMASAKNAKRFYDVVKPSLVLFVK